MYRARFARTTEWRGLHLGIYRSFAEARADAPVTRLPVGYALDDDAFAASATRIASHDYPVLFHLTPLMPSVAVVFDYGGHVGVHYLAYRPHLAYRPDLRWIVGEQPEVAARGEASRRAKGLAQLEFVTDFAAAEGADLLLSAGTIQFIEQPLVSKLAGLARRPPHVILNKIPVTDHETRVTLQNTGRSLSPCWIFGRDELVAGMRGLGYQLVDQWRCPERVLRVPFHPRYSIGPYSGFYFRAA